MAWLFQPSHALLSLLLLLFISSSLPHSLAFSKKQSAAARKDGIPFIKCQVCEKIAHQIVHQVKQKEAQISPKKISEFQIIEIAENICNLKKDESDWILQIDLVEKGDKLELVEQAQDLQLISFLCKDISKACYVKPPPLPADRIPGEAFIAKPTKEAEMDKILRSMEGMPGAPGMKMYSREDLMSGNFGGGDEDDEDEDEEDNFSEKLGNILKSKDPPKQDYRQTILQRITETGMAIKRHMNIVSKHAKSWWRKLTKGASPAKAKKIDL